MEDISIELLEKIQKEFEEEFTKSKRLEGIYKRIFEGTADYEEAHQFAIAIGDMLQGILEKHMVAEKMPNGKIYQNIAEKILRPTLKNNYELTTDVTTAVQSLINASKGINIQSMVPEFPEDKVTGIILNTVNENKLSTDVVSTFTQGIVDSAVEANFSFATEAGLRPIPKRIVMGDCCDWCKEVAGKVDPDADLYDIGFYRRHKSCKCLVLMDYGRRKESVYSKQQYKSIEEAMTGEHAYLGALDKLTRQQRYDRKNAAYRAYYKNKRLKDGKTYKARRKVERGRKYEDTVLNMQRDAVKQYRSDKKGYHIKQIGMLNDQGKNGILDIEIDEFVPCLKDNKTGEYLETQVYRIMDPGLLKPFNKGNGWGTNWVSIAKSNEVYALTIKGDDVIQGLIGFKYDYEAKGMYLAWASAAPWNVKILNNGYKEYTGVGGHLFAIAAEKTLEIDSNGWMYGFAKNQELLNHYMEKLGASHMPIEHLYEIIIDTPELHKLIKKYNYEWKE